MLHLFRQLITFSILLPSLKIEAAHDLHTPQQTVVTMGRQKPVQKRKKSSPESIKQNPSKYFDQSIWEKVEKHLIEDDHPIKGVLDRIFHAARVTADEVSFEAAGFTYLPPQHNTQIIVARHPDLQGYVLKLYLDNQDYFKEKKEYVHFLNRIRGANKIRQYIKKHHYGQYFKAPRKWLYLLPDHPSPPHSYLRKNFVLIAEDMEIHEKKESAAQWSGPIVTKEMLLAFYHILTDLGLRDSAKPSNCPMSLDGRGSFVDTEIFSDKNIKYRELIPFLAPPLKIYWIGLYSRR